MDSNDYDKKVSDIRHLASLPGEALVDHLDESHSQLGGIAPNILPHIHLAANRALQFLNSKLPSAGNELPMDTDIKPASAQKRAWLDIHDTINDPLKVLDKIKNNTLNRHHIEALQTVYPDLHQEIIQKMQEQIGELKSKGQQIPKKQRLSISMFMGQPLDSIQTSMAMQSILKANNGAQSQNQPQGKQRKASAVELREIDQSNAMYATSLQNRQINKRK